MTTILTSSPVLHDQPAVGDDVALFAAGEEKLPTIDPESLDATRPVDLDLCPVCEGLGGYTVASHDPFDDAGDGVECWACGGTGQRGAA